MVIVSSMTTQIISSKLKEKIPRTQKFRVFSYVRETLTVLGTGFRKERKSKQIS